MSGTAEEQQLKAGEGGSKTKAKACKAAKAKGGGGRTEVQVRMTSHPLKKGPLDSEVSTEATLGKRDP